MTDNEGSAPPPSAPAHVAGTLDARVGEVMTRNPLIIDSGATLQEAQEMLARHSIHHLLVEDRGRIVGVLSDRDVLKHSSAFAGKSSAQTRDVWTMNRRVYQWATFDLVTVDEDTYLYEATAMIIERGISCLPVRDAAGQIIGIVTTRDLLRGLLSCVLPPPAADHAAPGAPPSANDVADGDASGNLAIEG